MATKPQKSKGRENALSVLNAAINAIHLTKDAVSGTPAEVAFSAASILLTAIRVSFPFFRD